VVSVVKVEREEMTEGVIAGQVVTSHVETGGLEGTNSIEPINY